MPSSIPTLSDIIESPPRSSRRSSGRGAGRVSDRNSGRLSSRMSGRASDAEQRLVPAADEEMAPVDQSDPINDEESDAIGSHSDGETTQEHTLVSLSEKRDLLLDRRKQLQDKIRSVQREIQEYDKLTNSAGNEEKVRARSTSAPVDDELAKLRAQLNKLPLINNWNLRLELLKLFQPQLDISISSIQVVDTLKYVRYQLKYHKLFTVFMTLRFDMAKEVLIEFTMKGDNLPTDLSDAIVGSKDITFVIYAINSYVRLLGKKIDTWTTIYDDYSSVYDINGLATSANDVVKFIKFKNSPVLSITKPANAPEILYKRLSITWKFQVDELGAFETRVGCVLTETAANGQPDDTKTVNFDQLINELIVQEGLVEAISKVIDNLLGS